MQDNSFQGRPFVIRADRDGQMFTIMTPWVRRGFLSAELHLTKRSAKLLGFNVVAKMHKTAEAEWIAKVRTPAGEWEFYKDGNTENVRSVCYKYIRIAWGREGWDVEFTTAGKT